MADAAQPFLDHGEAGKLAKLMALMIIIAHFRRKEMRSRWLAPGASPAGIQDHPAVPYLVENALLFGASYLSLRLFPAPDRTKPLRELALLLVKGVCMVDTLLLAQKIMISYVYPHVPYFSQRKPPSDLATLVGDYARTNLPNTIINSFIQLGILMSMPNSLYEKTRNPKPLRILPFLAKFLFGRLVVDIVFGLVHYAMHANPTVYAYVHKRHHEHTAPRTQTNYHFEMLDLFLEAIAPVLILVGSMHALGIPPSVNEQVVMATSYFYYESASHSGKELPAVTWFPLLSPLVGWLTGSDNRLVEYHTRHHQLYNCNYSISPWPDKLCGTYRIDLPQAYSTAVAAYDGDQANDGSEGGKE